MTLTTLSLRGSALYALFVLSLLGAVLISGHQMLTVGARQSEVARQRNELLLATFSERPRVERPEQRALLDKLEEQWQLANYQSAGDMAITLLAVWALLLATSVYVSDYLLKGVIFTLAGWAGAAAMVTGAIFVWPLLTPTGLLLLGLVVCGGFSLGLERRYLLQHEQN